MIKTLVEEILGTALVIEPMIDSRTVFNVVAKEAKTTERRLQTDIFALRQSFDTGELNRMPLIPGQSNPADPLTNQHCPNPPTVQNYDHQQV